MKQLKPYKHDIEKEKFAIQWFKNEINNINDHRLIAKIGGSLSERKPLHLSTPPVCEIIYYEYDPLHKNTKSLPFYDKYPLTLIASFAPNHFYGFNLHYLDFQMREKLVGAVYKIKSKGYSSKQSFQLLYPLLKQLVDSNILNYAYKCYLFEQVVSKFVIVNPEYYKFVVHLPIQKFIGQSQQQVIQLSKRVR